MLVVAAAAVLAVLAVDLLDFVNRPKTDRGV